MSKPGQAGWQLAKDLSKMINNMMSEIDESFVEEVCRPPILTAKNCSSISDHIFII